MTIDINMDVGEGLNNEAELFPYISSCNIACGGHAGHLQSMRDVMALAKEFNVKVGAHPSYPDTKNFGRQVTSISNKELDESIQQQLEDFITIAQELNIKSHHIKAHGALYNKAVKDKDTAMLFLHAIRGFKLPIYAPFNSQLAVMAGTQGIKVYFEGFADRNYNQDLSLVSRKKDNALILDQKDMFDQVIQMIKHSRVKTINGSFQKLEVQTICLHSDSSDSEHLVKSLNFNLKRAGIKIK